MIGIICITATLIFDESESAGCVSIHRAFKIATVPCLGDVQSACSASWSRNVTAHKASIAKGVLDLGAAEAMRQARGWIWKDMSGHRAQLSIVSEGRLGRGREARMDYGRTVRIRRLDHGLASRGQSQ